MVRSGTFPPRGHHPCGRHSYGRPFPMAGTMTAQLHDVPEIKTSKECRKTTVYRARGRDQGGTDIPRVEARNPTRLKCPLLP